MLVAASALIAAAPAAASAEPPAAPFVAVHATLKRDGDGAIVTGRVEWDGAAASRAPDYMSEGDLRLVAVSDHGHRPKLLAGTTYKRIADDPTEDVEFHLKGDAEQAIAAGNRVVLTASQHGAVSQGTRTGRTYVTVDQLQPFGTKQDRIGRLDCADVAIVPGAKLNECDLVGADLERAQVSVREPVATRMLLADLTGANLRGADLSGLSVAGGRLNGADATNAVLDNLSLAGAEATGLDARDATSDREKGTAGANIFDARLTDADFQGAVLNGVSLDHSDLGDADFRGATWNAVEADTASFRGADLSGLKGVGSSVYFADFTDAKLQGAPFTAIDLAWATLCHTQLPVGGSKALEDRDCRAKVEPDPKPLPGAKVVIDASLQRSPGEATIKATIDWNAAAIGTGMTAGDLRAVAIDGSTGLPTTLAAKSIPGGLTATTEYEATITDPDQLAALSGGNRVVLTATQHPPIPTARGALTNGSYVTVDTLQVGPGRGRVGSRNCSDLLLGPTAPVPAGYDFCDLAGAVLTRASLSGPMHEADLTGAVLGDAKLSGIVFDGAALGGAVMTGAEMASVSMIDASAPRLTLPKTLLRSPKLRAANLDQADFAGDTISDGTFAASSLRRANFGEATFDKVDLGYARLAGADLAGVEALSPDPRRPRRSSLFLADLTGATLAGSEWADDEAGERPWQWATLCDTVLPADAEVSGDRDCPRSYRG
ncbi:MAG TPA: pentapeptide repeat-containing protein [Solirubrobacterales bacterium]|nr:pentapeptide repeat-containing protein [Solirubrobacterales bacterium]